MLGDLHSKPGILPVPHPPRDPMGSDTRCYNGVSDLIVKRTLPMAFEIWLAFIIASSVLILIPGPTVLTVVSYSIAHGKRATLPLTAAVALGDSTALLLSLLGLGALLATSAVWFSIIKWVGGLYLIVMGIKLFISGVAPLKLSATSRAQSNAKLFFNTWLVTALNPKGMVFFVAFLPQFINPAAEIAPQLWILSMTFVFLATLSAALYALFAQNARQLLSSASAQRRFNVVGGSLLVAAGIWALSARRAVSV